MRPHAHAGSLLLVLVFVTSLISACANSVPHSASTGGGGLAHPQDPAAVTVRAGLATTLNLGNGADLIIPPGAMTAGATVRATYRGQPGGDWIDIAPTSAPVELISNPPDAIHGLLTLEFPVPLRQVKAGIDPAIAFGISTYDLLTRKWTPFASAYDAARHMVVALIPHFSWWNPFTWDFGALFASIAQGFGQVVGTRAGQAFCSNGPPNWVNTLAGITNEADVAIRSCAASQGDILDVEMVNNRPYGQVLTYGSGVKWGWHESGTSLVEAARDRFMDRQMSTNELYLPPLSHASVGIFEPAAGTLADFHIGVTGLSLGADLVSYALAQVSGVIPGFDDCKSFALEAPLQDLSVSGVREDLLAVIDCLEEAFPDLVASGLMDNVQEQTVAALFAGVKIASTVARGIEMGGAIWTIADLTADWFVNRGTTLGNGFSLLASAQPTATPTPVPPVVQPTPQPTPTAAPTPQPVDAYANYGPANAGHAMCRGNPGNALSMPGGTASQTFTVPAGVASLTSALIQIDPDSAVTAHLSIAINGTAVATADAIAVGDTRFQFGSIAVNAGETITLSVSFTATYGKIITVYTAGSPGGTFTASNSCPDGAPNVQITSTGLRAVVSGLS